MIGRKHTRFVYGFLSGSVYRVPVFALTAKKKRHVGLNEKGFTPYTPYT